MEFEFDDSKSQSNLAKHGINFKEAQQIWDDSNRVEIPARTEDEARFLVIGKIAQKCWSAIITYRQNRVRIISVRRSRKEEVAIYESNRI
ncbi:MAG: BrnT family toxin [Moorea sp. SIO4G2]|uniref:BrnT family toxin n=1 Tax=Moorena sp. SIO4A1 TaxID=2607835 RepID=UPI0013FBBF56|nr:BrnT family toxin [Moorena sp. SIO4A1]NEO67071.1 BrnT family toxin [Moorena sp. SIO4G2]NEQ63746.1 BrnT family toxin [Moorena sp. SIO4A1]